MAPGLLRQYGETNFVTGMRAIAAFLVIGIHTGAFIHLGPLGENLTGNGKYGVEMFFVISGFTVAATFTRAPNFQGYFARRFFRIAPLYYLIVGLMFGLILAGIVAQPVSPSEQVRGADLYNALMHITFLRGWDASIANTILGVQWTIPIEVFWYLFLPLLLPLAASKRVFWWAFLAIVLFSALSHSLGNALFYDLSGKFFPTSYGAHFFLGAAAWFARKRVKEGMAGRPEFKRAIAGFLLLVIVLFAPTNNALSPVLVGVATALVLSSYQQNFFWTPLCTRPFLLLGSISYSLYLWHILVISVLPLIVPQWQFTKGIEQFALVSLITILLSILTYITVERPTNRWGAMVAARLNKRSLPTPSL